MSRSSQWLIGITALALWALVFGFVLFANNVTRESKPLSALADGIVVFTGEALRLKEAARLLKNGQADHLLISGVNPKVRAKLLGRLIGLSKQQLDCCVTLGYDALNTLGNANETRAWADARKLKSLIVVTASYHMPRAMAELSLAIPDTKLVSHEVLPSRFRNRAWWLHLDDTFVLVSEYLKFLPVAVRATAVRHHYAWTGKTAKTSASSMAR